MTSISDAVVEAAAKASFAHWQPRKVWGENQRIVDIFMEDTRIILEAAAPHMLAEAWDEGATVAWEASGEGWNGEYPGEPFANNDIPNPYRNQA